MEKLIIFFDGNCLFCNYWVRKLCHWDSRDRLRFATLDNKMVMKMVQKTGFDHSNIDSIIVWDQKKIVTIEAQAVFLIIRQLGFWWKPLLVFQIFPISLFDRIYRWIAKNRIRWFGQIESCSLPPVKFSHKFV